MSGVGHKLAAVQLNTLNEPGTRQWRKFSNRHHQTPCREPIQFPEFSNQTWKAMGEFEKGMQAQELVAEIQEKRRRFGDRGMWRKRHFFSALRRSVRRHDETDEEFVLAGFGRQQGV